MFDHKTDVLATYITATPMRFNVFSKSTIENSVHLRMLTMCTIQT